MSVLVLVSVGCSPCALLVSVNGYCYFAVRGYCAVMPSPFFLESCVLCLFGHVVLGTAAAAVVSKRHSFPPIAPTPFTDYFPISSFSISLLPSPSASNTQTCLLYLLHLHVQTQVRIQYVLMCIYVCMYVYR